MAMSMFNDRFEFELRVKHFGYEDGPVDPYYNKREEEPKEILKEDLSFKSLTAVEVMRKLLDYLKS